MIYNQITPLASLILRFYAKCFTFPYEEMNYELQHQYRVIEREAVTEEETNHVDQILTIINYYQGAEIKDLRDDYVNLFTSNQDVKAPCPMIASEFLSMYASHYDPDKISDSIWESGIPINPDEPIDSILNYLEYLSLLCQEYSESEEKYFNVELFLKEHILIWIPQFCEALYKVAQVEFYREVAAGLKNYLFSLQ